MIKKIFILIPILAFSLSVSAQWQHDEQKEKQIRSMEAAHWDFAPDWFYYFFHKDYSGAENIGNGEASNLATMSVLRRANPMSRELPPVVCYK